MSTLDLSVCMIVRNEADVLRRCLDSVARPQIELCVVDTGSTDETKTVVRSYGGKIVSFIDCLDADGRMADFARARNKALQLATGRWVLQIDADEVLTCSSDRLDRHLDAQEYGGVRVLMVDGIQKWLSMRLFRRDRVTPYRSRVHEYLDCSAPVVTDDSLIIQHLPDKRTNEPSGERNVRLARLEAHENPGQRSFYYLGRELFNSGSYQEAYDTLRTAVSLPDAPHYGYWIRYFAAKSQLGMGDLKAAVDACDAAIGYDTRLAEGYCLKGDLLISLQERREAAECFRRALACGSPPPDSPVSQSQWAYGTRPQEQLRRLGFAIKTVSCA